MKITYAVIDEIVKQGMVRVADPDPGAAHVFVWNLNAVDQLDAAIVREMHSCVHPKEKRFDNGVALEWCRLCGGIRIWNGSTWEWRLPEIV